MSEDAAKALAADKGFIYWPGGDEAPADWDGGPYLCRDGKTYHMCGYDWRHGTGAWTATADWDRIGYRSAQAMSAGTAETLQAAQGDSPPARSEGCAQTPGEPA